MCRYVDAIMEVNLGFQALYLAVRFSSRQKRNPELEEISPNARHYRRSAPKTSEEIWCVRRASPGVRMWRGTDMLTDTHSTDAWDEYCCFCFSDLEFSDKRDGELENNTGF